MALIVFVVALGINFASDASIYTDFASAEKSGEEVHIVGSWINRDKGGYDAERDIFTFVMQDTLNRVETVIFHDPKPMNLEQAEKVVVIGAYEGEQFVANKIVTKCPSKYEPDDITAKESE